MAKSTTFSNPLKRSSFPTHTKILPPGISLRVKTTEIYNQYYLYSIDCADGSSILEVVDFTVSNSRSSISPLYRVNMASAFIIQTICSIPCILQLIDVAP